MGIASQDLYPSGYRDDEKRVREDKTSVIASPRCWNYKQAGTTRRGRGDLPDCSTGRQDALWVSLRRTCALQGIVTTNFRSARTKHPSSRAPAAVITSKQELQEGGVAICLKAKSKIFRCGLCPSGYRDDEKRGIASLDLCPSGYRDDEFQVREDKTSVIASSRCWNYK